jgi:hypothetical protein
MRIAGGIFGDGVEWGETPPAPVEQPRVIWTDDGIVLAEERYAAHVIIPECRMLH